MSGDRAGCRKAMCIRSFLLAKIDSRSASLVYHAVWPACDVSCRIQTSSTLYRGLSPVQHRNILSLFKPAHWGKGRGRMSRNLTFSIELFCISGTAAASAKNAAPAHMLLAKFHAAIHPTDLQCPSDSACAVRATLFRETGSQISRLFASSLEAASLITEGRAKDMARRTCLSCPMWDCPRGFASAYGDRTSAAPSAPASRRPLPVCTQIFSKQPASLQICHWLHSQSDTNRQGRIFSGPSHERYCADFL